MNQSKPLVDRALRPDAVSQTRILIERAQRGDAAALARMVEDNLALVKYVVKRFQSSGKDWDDLYQLGCLGLVKAVKNFNMTFDVRFSTYAVPVILGEVRRYLRDDGPMRVSRSIKDNARRIAAYVEKTEAATGVTPTLIGIADALGMDRETALLALDSMRPTKSFSEPIGPDGTMTLADMIGEDQTAAIDRRIEIEQLLATLQDQERELLVRRYYDQQTQSQIACAFGMTQVQISRMESRLLKRLREIAQAV